MSSAEDEPSPKKKMKVLKLQGGVMVVRYVGYKSRGDKEMIVELEFCFDSDPLNPKIVGGYLIFLSIHNSLITFIISHSVMQFNLGLLNYHFIIAELNYNREAIKNRFVVF